MNPNDPTNDPTKLAETVDAVNQPAGLISKAPMMQEQVDGLLAIWDSQATAVRTSLDPSQQRGRALISQCLAQADHGILEVAKQELKVVEYFAHIGELENPATGELEAKIRCVLILEDGRKVSTWSPSAIKGFAFIAQMRGPGPWNPPLTIKVNVNKGKKGFNYATVSEVIEATIIEPTPATTKKQK